VLPFYGVPGDADRDQAVDHIIRAQALNLQSFDWKDLVKIMEAFDSRQFES
jgi:hypothetical protein